MVRYAPKLGDIIYLDFNPQSGHEQAGRRPAVVVSNTIFNSATKLAFVCPITSRDKGYPFHIKLTDTKDIHGFVMIEHIKSLDYSARNAKFIEKASDMLIEDIKAMIEVCF